MNKNQIEVDSYSINISIIIKDLLFNINISMQTLYQFRIFKYESAYNKFLNLSYKWRLINLIFKILFDSVFFLNLAIVHLFKIS